MGRLDEHKNPLGLLQAVAGLNVHLVMMGNGTLQPKVEALAGELDLDITLIQRVSHMELPHYLNQASLFVLLSFYEGHPKTLLEAMACGLPVIGTDVPGIREVTHHHETGYLCGTSPEEIRAAIQDVLSDADLRARTGCSAREFVVEHLALERVVGMELALLSEVVSYPPYDSSI